MSKVHLEILSWATRAFDSNSDTRMTLEAAIEEGETVADLFTRLADHYKGFKDIAFDPATRSLTSQVAVIHSGRLLELEDGVNTRLKDGDSLLLVPAIAGGATPGGQVGSSSSRLSP